MGYKLMHGKNLSNTIESEKGMIISSSGGGNEEILFWCHR